MKKDDSVHVIMDSFRRIVRTLRTASRTSETDVGLRAAQLFVLQQLLKFEPVSLNELAEKTYSHQSTVSVVIHSLEKSGFVRRNKLKTDRRFLVIETTAKGKALLKKRRPTVQEQFVAALEEMTPKERSELARLLNLFALNAGLSRETPHFFFEHESKRRS